MRAILEDTGLKGGFWLDPTGRFHEFGRGDSNGSHQSLIGQIDVGPHGINPEHDNEARMYEALRAGWVRGSLYLTQIGLHWEAQPSKAAVSALLRWFGSVMDEFDCAYFDMPLNQTQSFDNTPEALRFLREKLTQQNAVVEDRAPVGASVLYHGTPLFRFVRMLRSDTLKTNSNQRRPEYGQAFLTRKLGVAEEFGMDHAYLPNYPGVVLILDRDRLKQNIKLVPYNWVPENSRSTPGGGNEAEEITDRPITPLRRYLLGIILSPLGQEYLEKSPERISRDPQIIEEIKRLVASGRQYNRSVLENLDEAKMPADFGETFWMSPDGRRIDVDSHGPGAIEEPEKFMPGKNSELARLSADYYNSGPDEQDGFHQEAVNILLEKGWVRCNLVRGALNVQGWTKKNIQRALSVLVKTILIKTVNAEWSKPPGTDEIKGDKAIMIWIRAGGGSKMVESEQMVRCWHVTPTGSVRRIMKRGLIPQIGARSRSIGETEPAVYVFVTWADLEGALCNWLGVAYKPNQKLTVLELTVPQDWIKSTGSDYERCIYQTVPPEQITVKMDADEV